MSSSAKNSPPVQASVRLRVSAPAGDLSHDWHPEAGPLTIGRGVSAGLRVPEDVLSREHLRLQMNGSDIVAIDLNSRNGLMVNEQRVWQPTRLGHRDRLSVGEVVIEVELDAWQAKHPGPDHAPQPEDDAPTRAIQEPASAPAPTLDMTIATASGAGTSDASATHTQTHVADLRIDLPPGRIILGRDPQCDHVLDSLMISRLHTEVLREADRTLVKDLNSTNGTAVNGTNITRRTELSPGDRLTIGPFHFEYDGRSLLSEDTALGVEVRVQGLSRVVKNLQTGKPLALLDDVSCTILPNSFVGLLGPSGCGKSTLMDALNGRRRGSGGRVCFNGADLYKEFDAFKAGIGYVPQELIFHDALPLGEALRFASRLRLSADISQDEVEANIQRVLEVVGLADRRGTVIRHLSGGQKKRVSIAIELLSDPDILFLDEVTSGLDLGTEKEMMELFRQLADGGKTIICITHFLESLRECDKLICLMQGRLIFDGRPEDMVRHFEIDEMREIYRLDTRGSAEDWRKRFLETPEGVALDTQARAGAADAAPPSRATMTLGRFAAEFFLQLRVLTQRNVRLLTLDRKMLALLILLAPLIGAMLCVYAGSVQVPESIGLPGDIAKPDGALSPEAFATQQTLNDEVTRVVDDGVAYEQEVADLSRDYRKYYIQQRVLLYGSVLAAMFLSMFAAVQEIVKELPVYHHERFVKLQVLPYLLSKVVPLCVLGAVQSALLLAVIHVFADIDAGSFLAQFAVVFLMSVVGTMLGLTISAGVPGGKDSANIAVLLMIAVVIPQILFSGGLGPLEGIAKTLGQWGVACYWGLEALTSRVGLQPPDAEAYPVFEGMDDLVGERYWLSLAVLGAHAVGLGVLLVVFMIKKDGVEAIRKLRTGLKQIAGAAG